MLILGSLKAITPLAVAGILFLLNKVGVTADMSINDALTLVVTAALVWLVPNKK